MYILEILFAIGILISLILPGACYELYFRKLPTNINNLLVGFLILITFGTITKILTFSFISNQKVWLFSYLLILAISIIYLLRKKSLNIVIKSFISLNYLNFIFFFLIVIFIRYLNPDIIHTEKIMEYMILSSSMNGDTFIPKDLWFHNQNISYYSYGYFVFSSVPQIINLDSEIAYNFILPIVISLSYLSVVSLLSNFIFSTNKTKIIYFYMISFIFTFFLAPLIAIFEFFAHLPLGSNYLYDSLSIDGLHASDKFDLFWPSENWWWFSISRIINFSSENIPFSDYTINEFPSFSIILGDIHPHVLAIPIVIFCLSKIISTFYSKEFSPNNLFIINLLLLITILINPWYIVPIIWFLFLQIIFHNRSEIYTKITLKRFFITRRNLILRLIFIPVIISFFALLIINPTNQLQFPYLDFVKISSRFIHIFLYWGFPFIIIFISLLASLYKEIKTRILFLKLFLLIIFFSFTFSLISKTLYLNLELFINYVLVVTFFSFLISAILYLLIINRKDTQILIILLSNLTIIYGSEFLYVVDAFDNRMNTIFKFYFICYIFINIISSYLFFRFLFNISIRKKSIIVVSTLVILVPSIWWSIASIATRNIDNGGENTLNGLSYLDDSELEIISYIKHNIPADEIVLEGVGKSYTKSNFISSATSRSTALAWTNHQLQWRKNTQYILDLEKSIEDFYNNPTLDHHVIKTYNISYIIFSDYERLIYKDSNISNFDKFNLLFDNEKYRLYSLN